LNRFGTILRSDEMKGFLAIQLINNCNGIGPKTSMDEGIEILLFMTKKMKKKLGQTS
jgi:hypothetical protein